MINLKTKITQIHYQRDPEGIIFDILKFASYFYAFGSGFKNFLYDKKILRPKKVKELEKLLWYQKLLST